MGACGGRQRKSPTGGAAKGMPLYVVTPSCVVPWTNPDCMRTGLDVCAGNPATEASAAQTNARVLKVLIFISAFRRSINGSLPPFSLNHSLRSLLGLVRIEPRLDEKSCYSPQILAMLIFGQSRPTLWVVPPINLAKKYLKVLPICSSSTSSTRA